MAVNHNFGLISGSKKVKADAISSEILEKTEKKPSVSMPFEISKIRQRPLGNKIFITLLILWVVLQK